MEKEKPINADTNVEKINPDLPMVMESFNDMANELRELLDKDIKKPFEIDPMLTLELEYKTPYELNAFMSKYIFNSTNVKIMGIRIIESFIELKIADDKGNVGVERIYLGKKTDTIKFWEYYIIAMISWSISVYIEEIKEQLRLYIENMKVLINNAEN